MKILLTAVNAKFIHSNPAVHSLRAYAKDYRAVTDIAEYTINQRTEEILRDLYERRPDVIAFSCYIWNWKMIRELLRELPKILPETELWLGGPEVSFDAAEILRDFPALRGIMIGEGEQTFAELCRHWTEGMPELNGIAGLCLREGFTAPRELTDLNTVPFFYDDLSLFRDRILYYESSRGCPFRCSYCLSSIDKSVRFRDLETVCREMDFFLDHRVTQVKFIDRTFNCDRDRALKIWRYLSDHDNGITNFHFEIAADLMTEEQLELLNSVRPGLFQLEIGVQTTHPETVAAIDRRMEVEKVRQVVARLNEGKNIHLHLDLIAGLPEEDLPTFRNSFNEVYAMGAQDLQLGFLKVLKGSPMAERAAGYGLEYLSEPPYEVLKTRWMSYGDLLELKRIENVLAMFHNSRQFERTVSLLVRESRSAFDFYGELADFYRREGYEENQPSRAEKLNLLLRFAAERHPEKENLYRELITCDAYSRENCKRRPDFARDLSPWKDSIRERTSRRDSHAEPFFYRVWEDDPGAEREEPVWIIFDYEHRDPRTGNAEVTVSE